MKRTLIIQIFTFLVIALFIGSYFPQTATTAMIAKSTNNWVAQPMHTLQVIDPLGYSGYTPTQIRTAYGLPSSGGAGSTIAIIDVGDTPSVNSDLTMFSSSFNLPPPNSTYFEIEKMPNVPTATSTWMTETCLDVEWAHAIAPQAKILLIEAASGSSYDLLSAVDYARNRPDVVAVSMSWGGPEDSESPIFGYHFTSNFGAVFFASSGDKGSSLGVYWPASSANVVAVGGTVLNLNIDGSVNSETGWSGSGGGISSFENMPAYQKSCGLDSTFNTTERVVPDVSYNAGAGVAVYCNASGGWVSVGGTSAGAPQWAAIQALGRSASNANLYQKSKTAYSSYFRDIISGSNGGYIAGPGYDLVTGLGSPLTDNFNTTLTVSPTSGTATEPITISGGGLTPNNSANISWLNKSTWVSIANNVATDSNGNFTFSLPAPDLQQNNLAGDNQPNSDNIVFRAQDNGNSKSYNLTVSYSEWRRGLTQIANQSATGLYGNNTDLTETVFVSNGQSIVVAGEWFDPGNASLLWDGTTNLGTTTIDETGSLNTTIVVPISSVGMHTLTINDNDSSFCVNITRLPALSNDYDGQWHIVPFAINLTPDYNVNETYYSINTGPISNVTADGQPFITSDGSNNTLEYWSTWNVYGIGIKETPHVTLTGIKLDTIAPTGSITISNSQVTTPTVTLNLYASDNVSGVSQMRLSNSDGQWSDWQPYVSSITWNLQSEDGTKTVSVQYMDNAELISPLYNATVILQTSQVSPQSSQTISPQTTLSPLPTPTSTPLPTNSPTSQPTALPLTPELNIQMVLILLAIAPLALAIAYKRKNN